MKSRLHPLILLVSFGAFAVLVPAGYVASYMLGVPSAFRWRAGTLVSATVVLLANILFPIVWRFVNASTNATNWFSQKQAVTRVPISHVEAMIAAGRYDDATAEMDALLTANGLDTGLCLLAIDHHMGKFGSRSQAELLLRRMRAERPEQWEGFATQRLIDLYMTDPESHARAMTELRRMMARFPGTPDAAGAQACLDRLRRDQAVTVG